MGACASLLELHQHAMGIQQSHHFVPAECTCHCTCRMCPCSGSMVSDALCSLTLLPGRLAGIVHALPIQSMLMNASLADKGTAMNFDTPSCGYTAKAACARRQRQASHHGSSAALPGSCPPAARRGHVPPVYRSHELTGGCQQYSFPR